MYCPKCGSNQSEGRKFCTICGANLLIIAQALTGQFSPVYSPAPIPHPYEIERQRETAKGLKLTIIGGGFLAFKFFSMIFSGGSFNSLLSFVGFILLALGISRLIAYRPAATSPPPPMTTPIYQSPNTQSIIPEANRQPSFSSTPRTSELPPAPYSVPSVTEDDTRHLPQRSSQ